jgi:peptide/nickel transport system substrate-binding protein
MSSSSEKDEDEEEKVENEEINEIIKKSRIEGELEEGDQQRVMEILFKENPWIYLWTIHENYMVSERAFKYEYSENLLF